MKLSLDESVPRQLAGFVPDLFEMRTVQRMGWAESKNGDLLPLAAGQGFVEYQQHLNNLPIPVVAMIAHRTLVPKLRSLVPEAVNVVSGDSHRRIDRVEA